MVVELVAGGQPGHAAKGDEKNFDEEREDIGDVVEGFRTRNETAANEKVFAVVGEVQDGASQRGNDESAGECGDGAEKFGKPESRALNGQSMRQIGFVVEEIGAITVPDAGDAVEDHGEKTSVNGVVSNGVDDLNKDAGGGSGDAVAFENLVFIIVASEVENDD